MNIRNILLKKICTKSPSLKRPLFLFPQFLLSPQDAEDRLPAETVRQRPRRLAHLLPVRHGLLHGPAEWGARPQVLPVGVRCLRHPLVSVRHRHSLPDVARTHRGDRRSTRNTTVAASGNRLQYIVTKSGMIWSRCDDLSGWIGLGEVVVFSLATAGRSLMNF